MTSKELKKFFIDVVITTGIERINSAVPIRLRAMVHCMSTSTQMMQHDEDRADVQAKDVLNLFPSGQIDLQRSILVFQKVIRLSSADLDHLSGMQTVPNLAEQSSMHSLAELLTQLATLANLVAGFFSGDINKVEIWFTTRNPFFGNSAPRDVIRFGRYDRVFSFVVDALEENEGITLSNDVRADPK